MQKYSEGGRRLLPCCIHFAKPEASPTQPDQTMEYALCHVLTLITFSEISVSLFNLNTYIYSFYPDAICGTQEHFPDPSTDMLYLTVSNLHLSGWCTAVLYISTNFFLSLYWLNLKAQNVSVSKKLWSTLIEPSKRMCIYFPLWYSLLLDFLIFASLLSTCLKAKQLKLVSWEKYQMSERLFINHSFPAGCC